MRRLVVFAGLAACTPANSPKPSPTQSEAPAKEAATPAEAPKAPEPKPEPDPASEAKADTKAAPEPAPPEISKERALVLQGDAIYRLAPSGKTEKVVAAPGYDTCEVDDAHRVLWLASPTKIAAYDLVKGGEVAVVADGIQVHASLGDADPVWSIQYDDGIAPFPIQVAGTANGLEDCSALVVSLGPKPKVAGRAVAEGDREVYCYKDEGANGPVLTAEAQAVKETYDRAKLVNAPLLVAFDKRRHHFPPRAGPGRSPGPPPKLPVKASRCEVSPDMCGRASYVGGKRLWWVVTANSRGDFYHEDRELYDSKDKSYWDIDADLRFKEPRDTGAGFDLLVAPGGRWGLTGEKIVDLAEAKILGSVEGGICGWE